MARLPIISEIDLKNKVTLMRVDHNVVKKGKIKDPFKIDKSKKTISFVLGKKGFPVLMSHFGRPRNKKTNEINIREDENAGPVIGYIKEKWNLNVELVKVDTLNAPKSGITNIPKSSKDSIKNMKDNKVDIVYLPNTRWFEGEENGGKPRKIFSKELASLADIYVYDAFGSWQPHASTYDVSKYLPSYAGFLVQEEIEKLNYLSNPKNPFLVVIGGEKIDTKIDLLSSLHKKADNLILGGLPNNAFLCAKYNVLIDGINKKDVEFAKKLLSQEHGLNKILQLKNVIESDLKDEKKESKFREIDVITLKDSKKIEFIYDVAKTSFEEEKIVNVFENAKTIFINAVMGYDKVGYTEGTLALLNIIEKNNHAKIFFGGGDTLEALKKLTPKFYEKTINDNRFFLFTGGGTILKAIEEGSPYKLPTIKALIENKEKS